MKCVCCFLLWSAESSVTQWPPEILSITPSHERWHKDLSKQVIVQAEDCSCPVLLSGLIYGMGSNIGNHLSSCAAPMQTNRCQALHLVKYNPRMQANSHQNLICWWICSHAIHEADIRLIILCYSLAFYRPEKVSFWSILADVLFVPSLYRKKFVAIILIID